MNAPFTAAVASEHIADLRRAAERHRAAAPMPLPTSNERSAALRLAQPKDEHRVALRLAQPEDEYAVGRLAQLDDAAAPIWPVMLAVVDGEPVAALSLSDGRAVANPFVPTEKAVALLRLRAAQLSNASRERRRRWRPRILRPRAA